MFKLLAVSEELKGFYVDSFELFYIEYVPWEYSFKIDKLGHINEYMYIAYSAVSKYDYTEINKEFENLNDVIVFMKKFRQDFFKI